MASIDQKNYNKKFYQLFNLLVGIVIFKILIIFSALSSINYLFYNNYIKIVEESLIPYKDFYFEYIVKNFLYSYNSIIESDSLSQFYTFTLFLISDLGINWFLFISVLLLFLVKTFKNSFLN